MRTALTHWVQLWQRLGLAGDGAAWHGRLLAGYAESSRHYHGVQHLEECLTLLDEAKACGQAVANADAVELALWFHDAVYDSLAADNEECSASLAGTALAEANADPILVADITRLILATRIHQTNGFDDARWLIDIDLAILGQSQARFDEYECQIREEYAWVPPSVYSAKRSEIMAVFLARDAIYSTVYFRDRFESQSRTNIAGLMHALA